LRYRSTTCGSGTQRGRSHIEESSSCWALYRE
jgi:hypothetical protein